MESFLVQSQRVLLMRLLLFSIHVWGTLARCGVQPRLLDTAAAGCRYDSTHGFPTGSVISIMSWRMAEEFPSRYGVDDAVPHTLHESRDAPDFIARFVSQTRLDVRDV